MLIDSIIETLKYKYIKSEKKKKKNPFIPIPIYPNLLLTVTFARFYLNAKSLVIV